jgi:hypothetical protein
MLAQPVDATQALNVGWGSECQTSYMAVRLADSHFIQMSLRIHRQIGPSQKVLPEQTIGVLIGPALPRTLRVAEVNIDVGR